MTARAAQSRPDGPAHTRPWPVVAAFWLWWPILIVQLLSLVSLAIIVVQAAMIGGPAWDYVVFGAPVLLTVGGLGIAEALLVFRLRRGSRVARAWLLGLAILIALTSLGPLLVTGQPPSQGMTGMPPALGLALGTVPAALALVGGILPFIRAAAPFFPKRSQAPA